MSQDLYLCHLKMTEEFVNSQKGSYNWNPGESAMSQFVKRCEDDKQDYTITPNKDEATLLSIEEAQKAVGLITSRNASVNYHFLSAT